MTPTRELNQAGQSLWLDNMTRDLLTTGKLRHFIDDLAVTGLTSNPTIYDKAIGGSSAYDEAVRVAAAAGSDVEEIFFSLALDDLTQAADLFRPIYDLTGGVDGFVSLEVSPVLAYDADRTLAEAKRLHGRAGRPNLFIKIPGTREGLGAIEEAIFAGVPINVTLLFSVEHYLACAEAYTRGIERRVEAGLPAFVPSVASLFLSRWDAAVAKTVPAELKNQLGLAIGRAAYLEYRRFFATDRWLRLMNVGARPQRLLYASTGTKDPAASDILYITGLASPLTVNTMPEETLLAFADHGHVDELLSVESCAADESLARFRAAGIDLDAVAADLQEKGAASFVSSWTSLLERIETKRAQVAAATA